MAWKDTLLSPSFRGAPFEVLRTRDMGKAAVAPSATPYRNGGAAEDMGRDMRRIEIAAVFWGDAYETALQKLLKALDERGKGELVHPVFGPVLAQVEDWEVFHTAERPNYAEVAMHFVVPGEDVQFFATAWPKADAKAETARSGAAEVLARVAAAAKNARAMSAAGLSGLSGLKALATGVVTSGADILTAPAAWAADVTSLVSGFIGLKSFAGASLLSDYAAVLSRLSGLFGDSSTGSGGASATGTTSGVSAAAMTPAAAAAAAQAQAQVQAHVQLEAALGIAEAAQLVLESEAATPTLTPAQIEDVAATSRAQVQASIDTYRELYPLDLSRAVTEPAKDVAAAVQEAAAAVIEARPPLVEHTVAARTCPRLLAHQLYGDHTRAAEIQRLNALADPNFLTPGQELKVYAS
jgi:prophage DNA circulation protein